MAASEQTKKAQHSADQQFVKSMPPGLSALILRAGNSASRPPVENWDPPHCGRLPMTIKSDGTWHYLGTPILREALVRLFASVLRIEPDGCNCLVTPVEKVEIDVEDAHFTIVEMHVEAAGRDQIITCRTNVGDVVVLGADHPLSFAEETITGGLKPYVAVRSGLVAVFARHLVLELAEYADEASGENDLVVHSSGARFSSAKHRYMARHKTTEPR